MITIKSLELHQGQSRILKEIIKNDVKYNIIKCSRQFGKSILLKQILLYYAINFKNQEIAFITPTYKLSKRFHEEIISSLPLDIIKYNKSELSINFINGSVIKFYSGEAPDSMRGPSNDYVFIDEFSFMDCKSVWEAITPTMNAKKNSKCFISSTPFGKNLFYDFYQQGLSEDFKNWKSYYGLYIENPFYDLNEIENAKLTLPKKVYEQEIMGNFVDDGLVFDNINECSISSLEKVGSRFFAGIDIANINDFTVLTILNENKRVVFLKRWNKIGYIEIKKELLKYLRKFECYTIIETNVEKTLYELIEREYQEIESHVTNNLNKTELINNLIIEFQNKTIILPDKNINDDTLALYNELNTFGYEYSKKSNKIMYKAIGSFHDDCVISLCLALKSYNQNILQGNYDML